MPRKIKLTCEFPALTLFTRPHNYPPASPPKPIGRRRNSLSRHATVWYSLDLTLGIYQSPKPLYLLAFPSFPDLSQLQTIVFACFPSFSSFFRGLEQAKANPHKALINQEKLGKQANTMVWGCDRPGKLGKPSKYNGLGLS